MDSEKKSAPPLWHFPTPNNTAPQSVANLINGGDEGNPENNSVHAENIEEESHSSDGSSDASSEELIPCDDNCPCDQLPDEEWGRLGLAVSDYYALAQMQLPPGNQHFNTFPPNVNAFPAIDGILNGGVDMNRANFPVLEQPMQVAENAFIGANVGAQLVHDNIQPVAQLNGNNRGVKRIHPDGELQAVGNEAAGNRNIPRPPQDRVVALRETLAALGESDLRPEEFSFVPNNFINQPGKLMRYLLTTIENGHRDAVCQAATIAGMHKFEMGLRLTLEQIITENKQFRDHVLVTNHNAMDPLEDYPVEVNAHLPATGRGGRDDDNGDDEEESGKEEK